MAPSTLKTTPFCSLTITLIIITVLLPFPCLFTSVESLSSGSSTHIYSSKSFSYLITNTIHAAQNARSIALQLANITGKNGFDASMEIRDFVDLLDDSIDHLNSLGPSTYDPTQDMDNSDRSCNREINPCSALSATLANQEMCMEGLDQNFMDINSNKAMEKKAFIGEINQLNLLLSEILLAIMSNNGHLPIEPHLIVDEPLWSGQLDNNNGNNSLVADASDTIREANNKFTVAIDGSGDYTSITEAINAVPSNSNEKFTIYVKRGVYHEYLQIPSSKRNLVMIGDGIGATVITGSRNNARDHINTMRTATFAVAGPGFMAQDITFENTAGPSGHQAVALLANAENLVFYRCAFKGYQDTLYAKYGVQFYRECEIHGTVDFIFGDAKAVFQKCDVIVRKPLPKQYNTVTAQGRTLACSPTGFSFHDCRFTADDDLETSRTRTYLGRPWKKYSRTVVMNSYLGPLIDQLGWAPWDKNKQWLDTLYYGEYMNSGPGSDVSSRVKWPGFHPEMTVNEADKFTVRSLICGEEWLPSTGVPYDPDL